MDKLNAFVNLYGTSPLPHR